MFTTVRKNELQVKSKKRHTSTGTPGTGKDAIGKSGGQFVSATTKIAIKGRLCGTYPSPPKMLENIKHMGTEHTSSQKIQFRVRGGEPQDLIPLKMLPSPQNPAVPSTTQQIIRFKINERKRKKKCDLSLILHVITEMARTSQNLKEKLD